MVTKTKGVFLKEMGKVGKKILAWLLAITGIGAGFTAGAVIDEYFDLGIGEKTVAVWNRIFGKDGDTSVTEEKTGSLTVAACDIAQVKGESFYTATEARFAGKMNKKSKVTYTPIAIQTTNDNKIKISYKSSVMLDDETKLEDIVTATINVESNADNDALYADLVKALKTGDEATANEIIAKLSQSSNIEVGYALNAENNNANLSGALASKVGSESLAGLDEETQAAILAKIATKDYVVTSYELIPNDTNKGQVIENLEDVTNEDGTVTTYCDLTANLVKANATLKVCVGSKLYSITIKQGGLTFNLGRQPWNANGVSVEDLAKLINGLSGTQLEDALAGIANNQTEAAISYASIDLGTAIKPTKSVVVSMQYGATTTEVQEDDLSSLTIEVPDEEQSEEEKQAEEQRIEDQVSHDAQAAAMQVAKAQAAERERTAYAKGQQYNRQATNRNMTTTHRR